jgi:hypothetical protein
LIRRASSVDARAARRLRRARARKIAHRRIRRATGSRNDVPPEPPFAFVVVDAVRAR